MMVRCGIVVLLCLITGSFTLKIKEIKVPKAVEAGEDVTLSCDYILEGEKESSVYVKWWWNSNDGDADNKLIYQRFAGGAGQVIKQMFNNITAQSDDTIMLWDVEPIHSGTYECEVSAYPNEQRMGLALVVFTQGSGPELSVTQLESNSSALPSGNDVDGDGVPDDEDDDDDMILVECEATGVSPKPELTISLIGEGLNDTQVITENPELETYNITASLVLPKEVALDQEFQCQLFFEDATVAHPPYTDTLVYNSGGLTTTTEDDGEVATESTEPVPEPSQDDSSAYVGKSSLTIFILCSITFVTRWLIW